jgi:iron complex transport system substrate-binding protein
LIAVVVGIFAISLVARTQPVDTPAVPASGSPRRIVSMAPNLTETLFTLGLGDRVVGVTRYCRYPAEAARRAKIGGHLDPNFEAVVTLRPDLVVLLREQADLVESFAKLGIRTLIVSDNGLPEIYAAIERIGTACGVADRARRIVADMRRRVAAVARRTAAHRPRVLLVLDRTQDTGAIEDAYIVGRDGYLDRLVHLAGGRNAYDGPAVAYPVVSAEGLIHLDPDVIIDFSAGVAGASDAADHLSDWQSMPRLSAVRTGRIHALPGQGLLLPGPRTVDLLEALAARIHPEQG